MQTLDYYIELVITLCGLDGSQGSLLLGWVMVGLAALTVVYAFYQAVTKAIWPGESDTNHIKYRILEDDDAEISYAD